MELGNLLGRSNNNEEEEPWQITDSLQLSWSQRVMGFAICFSLGTFLGFLSSMSVFQIVSGHPARFAFPYTLSNILSLGSTMFLMGPVRQMKQMFAKTRIIAASIYIGMLILTLVLAFRHAPAILVLVSIILQMLALLWYSLSYIPFARNAVSKCVRGAFSSCI